MRTLNRQQRARFCVNEERMEQTHKPKKKFVVAFALVATATARTIDRATIIVVDISLF